MKNGLTALLCSLFFVCIGVSCVSTAGYNARLQRPLSAEELRSDVEYVQHKLVALHPDLYHYITRAEFERKFDSLRASLTDSLTSYAFYFKLSPLVASIRQGHTQLFPAARRLAAIERNKVNASGTSPLSQFEYELFDQKLYIVKNNSKDSTLRVGTALISVDGVPAQDILRKFEPTFTSDGYNSTFISRRLARMFPRYFYQENGLKDSVRCVVSFADSVRTVMLRRPVKENKPSVPKTTAQQRIEKCRQQAERKKRKLQGYDASTRRYSKQFDFYSNDSSIAVMKINDFSRGNYKKFYKACFQKLDSLHSKVLILDLRDNPGGRLDEVRNLYTYLADTCFRFIDKSEVVSRTSLWHRAYFSNMPLWQAPIRIAGLPFLWGMDAYSFLATRKVKDSIYQFSLSGAHRTKPASIRFKGKVYVLINGGSFSASSLLASNLSGSKRARFVGTETGGAYNGCVAGFMPVYSLPHSKLTLRLGLLTCKSTYRTYPDGRGVLPDTIIAPTLRDRIESVDPEMVEVIREIRKQEK